MKNNRYERLLKNAIENQLSLSKGLVVFKNHQKKWHGFLVSQASTQTNYLITDTCVQI